MNITNVTLSADPDPESAQWLGILYGLYAVIGIPSNLLMLILTITDKNLRTMPMNICIFSITFADMMALVSFLSATLWTATYDVMVCKVMGVGIYIFDVMSLLLPACLAVCRYAAVCWEQDLHPILRYLKTRRGILLLNAMFWTYGLTFTLPLIADDKFGLDRMGCCGVTDIDSVFLWTYYMIVIVGILFGAYTLMFIFYRKLGKWVKETSSLLTMSSVTRDTLMATRNLMRLLRWLLLLPVVVYYPALIVETILRVFPNAISVRTARYFLITVPLPHVCDPIVTLLFVKSYRTALFSLLPLKGRMSTRVIPVVSSAHFTKY
uniref:G-protein coupled receptors family 1 profile domain-containing protein n=1 Tax=Plectus sambesii TaxID=2011161 RepID=A0A914XHX3_9BILA